MLAVKTRDDLAVGSKHLPHIRRRREINIDIELLDEATSLASDTRIMSLVGLEPRTSEEVFDFTEDEVHKYLSKLDASPPADQFPRYALR